MNIKVSDTIYLLVELLDEVYTPHKQGALREENVFFQYAYFIMMIVTESSQAENKDKITLEKILKRVKDFSKELAEESSEEISAMMHRVLSRPFSP